jgi:hypothetical protein
MFIKRLIKSIILLNLFILIVVFCGCTGKFQPIKPPINEFPTAQTINTEEIIKGDLVVEKSFWGNFKDDGLYSTNNSLLSQGFTIGISGYVTYEYKNEIIKIDATLVQDNSSNKFIAVHGPVDTKKITYNYPGKFSTTIFQQNDCILIPKKAVILLDDQGNALFYQLDENNLLVEKHIKVGLSNDKYYQVIEGALPGEKAVTN